MLFQSLRRIADDHHHATTTAADGAVGSSFALNMEVVIRDLVGFVFNNIYTSTALQGGAMENFLPDKNTCESHFELKLQAIKHHHLKDSQISDRVRLIHVEYT